MTIGTAVAIASVVSAAVGTYTSIKQAKEQSRAADRAEELAEQNAQAELAETEESRRRLALEQERQLGASKAAVGASGLRMSGSQKRYIDDLSQNYKKELDWLTRSGASRAEIERVRGDIAAGEARGKALASYGQAASSLAGGVKPGYQLGKKWFT